MAGILTGWYDTTRIGMGWDGLGSDGILDWLTV